MKNQIYFVLIICLFFKTNSQQIHCSDETGDNIYINVINSITDKNPYSVCVPKSTEVTNCIEYMRDGDTYQCAICRGHYYASQNDCIEVSEDKRIDGCNSYMHDGICKYCEDYSDYKLTEDYKCSHSIYNCEIYLTIGKCKVCYKDYGVTKNGGCVSFIRNCKTYGDDIETCLECWEFYNVSADNKTCVDKIEGCDQYISENECSKCDSGYSLDMENRHCYNTISNCKLYETQYTCGECSYGILSADKKECRRQTNFAFILNFPLIYFSFILLL